MEGKQKISQYRNRLDKTLSSHDLKNEEMIKNTVRNHFLRPSQCQEQGYIEDVVQKRTKEVSNFIDMLRSASEIEDERSSANDSHLGWKIKQDCEDYRVMYREGPVGTPFHTLLVEGYVDGPVDVCLAVSWESLLYPKWWPQFIVPTFKVVYSECLQKVRTGEQISLMRMKLPWPLHGREALIHYFVFEYCQDDLIVVLLNSISDLESVDRSTHGFTRDGIPDGDKVVRVDVVGGMALQKVTANRSYFRTIANMDIKLDFVPPAFINFASRQIIGGGFKLYKKEVASVCNGDADFAKALKEPLYTRIREALYSDSNLTESLEPLTLIYNMSPQPEEQQVRAVEAGDTNIEEKVHFDDQLITIEADDTNIEENVHFDDHSNCSVPKDTLHSGQKPVSEIEEIEESVLLEDDNKEVFEHPANETLDCRSNNKEKCIIGYDVQAALETLDKAIAIFRDYKFNPQTWSPPGFIDKKITEDATSSDQNPLDLHFCEKGGALVDAPSRTSIEKTSHEPSCSSSSRGSRQADRDSYVREVKNKQALASPEEGSLSSCETRQSSFSFAINQAADLIALEKLTKEDTANLDTNSSLQDTSTKTKERKKRQRFCCLHFPSG